ncbi:tyrosine-protein phosphatase non-receptor type 2 isoform X1 [Frankliniella occidentalis]|uniref:protein-tyrosine-phosphatase n=1 Tax=Frankliniella occidentalis TaxID=133901 RepID=A0A6J1TF33_FRAOC|nr:tyrosine-protein phosphatase non-receptor type 2 isoform X1 [Frankliniella occidentalis]
MESEPPKSVLEKEFSDIDADGAWPLIFQHIRTECLNHDFSTNEAKKKHNVCLNRYRDVIPYDHSRIVLNRGPCEYINANLVKMEKARRQYILTQGPLPTTTGHFWLMVWEQKCKAIVMLNRIIEKKQIKCHQYWPDGKHPGVDDMLDLPDVGLQVCHLSEKTEESYYITRVFRLTDIASGESREVLQFHYMTWPDFGVPQSPTVFLRFLSIVRKSGALDSDVGPAIVHCSAGIGRSGTFCLVDSCLVLMEEYGAEGVNVREILLEMRRYRMGLAQTPDQLRFSYLAIIKGHNDGLEVDDVECEDNDVELENQENHTDEPPPLPPARVDSLITRPTAPSIGSPPSSPDEDSVSEADSSDESDSSDAPTRPLPTEPYSESMQTDSVSSEPPSRPLPELPEHMSSSDEGSLDVNSSPDSPVLSERSESDDGLRKRRKVERAERKGKMQERLQGMKRKQQQADDWQKLKRSIFQPMNIGLAILVLGGGALVYSYYASRS